MKVMYMRFVCLAMLCWLAGCGGGTSTNGAQPLPNTQPSPPTTTSVHFQLAIPGANSSSLRRGPAFVSPATRSLAIAVGPSAGSLGAPLVVDCASSCSGSIDAPLGPDLFSVKLYDAPNGGGNLLSTAGIAQTVVMNQTNTIAMVTNGVVAAFALAVGTAAAGTPGAVTVTVNALDSDGNTIAGPGSYVDADGNPVTITLTDSDTSGATALSGATVSRPAVITLNYTGLAIAPATIAASAAGFPNRTVSFAPVLSPIVMMMNNTPNPAFNVVLASPTGPRSTVRFTVTEAGWTEAPFNQTMSLTQGTGCGNIGTITQSGSMYTATVASMPLIGTCTALTLHDGVGRSQDITLSYTFAAPS
jgi:hypothetical protein